MLEPFAVPVIAFQDTGDEYVFNAIFDRPQTMYLDGLKVTEQDAKLTAVSSDVANLAQNMPLTVNSNQYKIREVLPDGTGITTINLLRMAKR